MLRGVMNTHERREIETMDRVDYFGKKPELILTPKVTVLLGSIATRLAAARAYAAEQVSGRSSYREGAAERQGFAADIRGKLRKIADLAKSMEEEGDTGMAERFRFPRRSTYEALLATASSFADKAEPMAGAFVERGLPATFVDDLRAVIAALKTATGAKAGSGSGQVAATAGLKALTKAGMKAVRALRPILRIHLQDDPALLAAWNSAARVARSAPREKTPPGSPDAEPPAAG